MSVLIECLFAEGSAKSGEGVEQAFGKVTQTIIYKIDSGEIPEASLSTRKSAVNSASPLTATNETAQGGGCTGYCNIF